MDDTSDTHGVAVTSVPLPGFPQGLLVVQDGNNPRGNQISSAYPGRRYVERSGFLGKCHKKLGARSRVRRPATRRIPVLDDYVPGAIERAVNEKISGAEPNPKSNGWGYFDLS